MVLAEQAAFASLMRATVTATAIQSFALDVVLDLQESIGGYEDLEVEIPPNIVPEKANFVDVLQLLQTARVNKPGCSIKLEIAADVGGLIFNFLEASYDAPKNNTTLAAALSEMASDSVESEQNAAPRCIEDDRITFRLDEAVHALGVSDDGWSEADVSVEDESAEDEM